MLKALIIFAQFTEENHLHFSCVSWFGWHDCFTEVPVSQTSLSVFLHLTSLTEDGKIWFTPRE